MSAAAVTRALLIRMPTDQPFFVRSNPGEWGQDDDMAYQVQWDTTVKKTKTNDGGTSGWVTCLAIHGRADVYTFFGPVTVGNSFRMHLCSETRCVAHWEASKYGVMGQPLHLILEEAPAPDHLAGPAVAGPLSMPGAVEEPEANADTPGIPVPESIPDAAEEPEAKVDTPAVAVSQSMPCAAEEPEANAGTPGIPVSESMPGAAEEPGAKVDTPAVAVPRCSRGARSDGRHTRSCGVRVYVR